MSFILVVNYRQNWKVEISVFFDQPSLILDCNYRHCEFSLDLISRWMSWIKLLLLFFLVMSFSVNHIFQNETQTVYTNILFFSVIYVISLYMYESYTHSFKLQYTTDWEIRVYHIKVLKNGYKQSATAQYNIEGNGVRWV